MTNTSNLDLLQILLGDEAQIVLTSYPRLQDLEDASAAELTAIGLSDTGVNRLQAVWKLSRRRAMEKAHPGRVVLTAADAFEVVEPFVRGEKREMLIALALDTKSRLLAPPLTIAIGTLSSAPIHPREIFRPLVRLAASSAILCHNHPSGEFVPSPDDVLATSRLKEAAELLGIPLADHLIIGEGYLSMRERGLM